MWERIEVTVVIDRFNATAKAEVFDDDNRRTQPPGMMISIHACDTNADLVDAVRDLIESSLRLAGVKRE